jgi:hypothetical protein
VSGHDPRVPLTPPGHFDTLRIVLCSFVFLSANPVDTGAASRQPATAKTAQNIQGDRGG